MSTKSDRYEQKKIVIEKFGLKPIKTDRHTHRPVKKYK